MSDLKGNGLQEVRRPGAEGVREAAMKTTLLVLILTSILGCSSSVPEAPGPGPAPASETVAQGVTTIPDSEIGLAPGTAFEQPEQRAVAFNLADPGESTIRPRPNAEFPPVIPHSVQDIGPITLGENPCLDCHAADVADEMGAVAIPRSHYMDLRNSPGEYDEHVTGARLVCTSCHVEVNG